MERRKPFNQLFALRVVGECILQRPGDLICAAVILQEFRHHVFAHQNIGQRYAANEPLPLHDETGERRHQVAHNHGFLVKRRLERSRPGSAEHCIGGLDHAVAFADTHDHALRQTGVLPRNEDDALTRRLVRCRNKNVHVAEAMQELFDGAEESWRTAFDFVNARARHDRHDWQRIFHQTIVTASAFRIRLHRNHAGQGMTDICCVNAGALINLLLEGEDQEHMVNRSADLVDALRTPGPNGRAHKMHGRNTAAAKFLLNAEVKVRRINAHKNTGA